MADQGSDKQRERGGFGSPALVALLPLIAVVVATGPLLIWES